MQIHSNRPAFKGLYVDQKSLQALTPTARKYLNTAIKYAQDKGLRDLASENNIVIKALDRNLLLIKTVPRIAGGFGKNMVKKLSRIFPNARRFDQGKNSSVKGIRVYRYPGGPVDISSNSLLKDIANTVKSSKKRMAEIQGVPVKQGETIFVA